MSYFRDNIEAMSPYVPGEQPGLDRRVVKLNTNENPYPPSPRAVEALRRFDAERLRLYPDPMADQLRRVAGDLLGVPVDWILPGDGSDDLIVMLARSCAGPGRPVAYPTPTFPFYLTQARIAAAEIVEVPFEPGWKLPVDALVRVNAALTFVANPNTPSGTMAGNDELAELAGRLEGLVVIDEAYVDFAESDALELVRRFENVVILRTLSKGYSLAGLRLGFAVAQPAVLQGLAKTKAIYNVSAVACAVGAAALADQDYRNRCIGKIKASRQSLAEQLAGLGFSVVPSQANFLLVRPPDGDAAGLYEKLKARGILVRYFNRPGVDDHVRITIGTDRQHERLVAELKDILS